MKKTSITITVLFLKLSTSDSSDSCTINILYKYLKSQKSYIMNTLASFCGVKVINIILFCVMSRTDTSTRREENYAM